MRLLITDQPGARLLSSANDVNSWLGRSNFASDDRLDATIEEFRFHKRELSHAEVLASRAAGPVSSHSAMRITDFSFNPAAGTVNLSFTSEPCFTCTIETSTDLQQWTTLPGAPIPGASATEITTVTGRPLQPPYTDRLLLRVRRP